MKDPKKIWSCYDCIWSSDKCKNNLSEKYDKFLSDIEECNIAGKVNNTLGFSWKLLSEEI